MIIQCADGEICMIDASGFRGDINRQTGPGSVFEEKNANIPERKRQSAIMV
jgi:hypothetical protein